MTNDNQNQTKKFPWKTWADRGMINPYNKFIGKTETEKKLDDLNREIASQNAAREKLLDDARAGIPTREGGTIISRCGWRMDMHLGVGHTDRATFPEAPEIWVKAKELNADNIFQRDGRWEITRKVWVDGDYLEKVIYTEEIGPATPRWLCIDHSDYSNETIVYAQTMRDAVTILLSHDAQAMLHHVEVHPA